MEAANGMNLLSYRGLAPSVFYSILFYSILFYSILFYSILFLLSELFLLTNTIGSFSRSRSFKSIAPKLLDYEQSLFFSGIIKRGNHANTRENCGREET